jgi:hypothetical protein
MMQIRIVDGLSYVSTSISYRGQQVRLDNVLLDTGSVGTVFAADKMLAIGLQLEAEDMIHRIRGVGGTEFVFTKAVDTLALGELAISQFEIEVGAMDYGFDLDGILGMDFLLQVDAVIDLEQMKVHSSA